MLRAPECFTALETASVAMRSRLYSNSAGRLGGSWSSLSFSRTFLVSVIWRAACAIDAANPDADAARAAAQSGHAAPGLAQATSPRPE